MKKIADNWNEVTVTIMECQAILRFPSMGTSLLKVVSVKVNFTKKDPSLTPSATQLRRAVANWLHKAKLSPPGKKPCSSRNLISNYKPFAREAFKTKVRITDDPKLVVNTDIIVFFFIVSKLFTPNSNLSRLNNLSKRLAYF